MVGEREGSREMVKYEFWCQLRKLERKYDEKIHSPVRARLARIASWASSVMDGWSPTERVPVWLCNELKHVEEGREVGSGKPGTPRERLPIYSDILFHGVLSDRPWGGPVLPSTFKLGKRKPTPEIDLLPNS